MYSNSSKERALSVLNPPQKPTIKNVLYAEQVSFFDIKYRKTTVAKKQPKKFASMVLAGK